MPQPKTPGHRNRRIGIHLLPSYLVTVPVENQGIQMCMSDLAAYFHLGEQERHAPHITLLGPFRLFAGCDPVSIINNCQALEDTLHSVRATLGAPLMLRGRKGFAVVISAEPQHALSRCAAGIRKCLLPHFLDGTWIDSTPGTRIYHISIAFGLHRTRAELILRGLEQRPGCSEVPPLVSRLPGGIASSSRIAVIRRGALWMAFDLHMRRWLSRGEIFRKSVERFPLNSPTA